MLGTVEYMQERFVFIETSFTKGSRQLILVSEEDLTLENETLQRRGELFYRSGGVLNQNYLLGILDPVRKKQFGTIPLLTIIYQTINEVVRGAKLAQTYSHSLGVDTFTHEGSEVQLSGTQYKSFKIETDRIKLKANFVEKVNVKPRVLGKLLTDITGSGGIKYNTSTFVDASLEYLERAGFDTGWIEGKKYTEIHTVEDWDNLVIPALMAEYRRWVKEKDFPYFLISVDFESRGLNAYAEIHPAQHKAVYFSISFKDNESFGVFVDMQNFDNVDQEGIAERLTYLLQKDLIEDRKIVLEHNGDKLEVNRSAFTVTGHNFMIDRRFGLTIGADVWFDLCTLQLSFNLDPFMTRGRNGLKDLVHKYFDVEYAELGDICGKKNKGMFEYLTDKRVIMMYGCADTDWHRLVAKKLITICMEAKDYYGVDHAEQHIRLDSEYMNTKASADYEGMRINYEAFEKEYEEKSRILNLYYSFMAQYVGRLKTYLDYEKYVVNAERFGVKLKPFSYRDLLSAPPIRVEKWSGQELLDILFKTLEYPILAWTKQSKKSKLQGRAFKPRPAINTDALKFYMTYEATVTPSRIDEAFEHQESLEDLKWFSTYLKEDYVDPVSGKVLISKKKFNSFRLPFMYVLNLISPLVKAISSDLKPIVEFGIDYRFASCNMASAVTRRDLNPVQTVSKKSKYNYIAYDDTMNYAAVDQSAVEIRILYGLSKDQNLIIPLNNPEKDTHTETAALMHQKPAYTITKDVRKGIKFLAFGRPYGKEIFSSCRDFFGDNSPEHMAEMAYLFQLYDNKLASVVAVLEKVRDNMDIPVDPPESLKIHLGFDPEKKYGRMVNEFGYCQHYEIREGDEGYRQSIRRKAGNFIIQGFAANLLRIIYMRMYKEMWKRGWIQNKLVRIHLTVHDEVDLSYSKSLNPVEVMSVMYESLTVKMKGFPTFFVGINFGNSWGEAKEDASELPVLLVKEMNDSFKNGGYRNPEEFKDHLHFFQTKREDFYDRRIHKEIMEVNDQKNVWDIEKINDKFTNYTVRSLLPDVNGKPLVKIDKKCEDPILLLISYLPKFIARYTLDHDKRKHHLVYRDKAVEITKDMLNQQFYTIADIFNGKPIPEEIDEDLVIHDLVGDMESALSEEFELDDDDLFDLDDSESLDDEEFPTDGITDMSSGFLESYNSYVKDSEFEKEYSSIKERLEAENAEARKKLISFDNFVVTNGKIILHMEHAPAYIELRRMCRGNTVSSGECLHLYVKFNDKLTDFGNYTVDFLRHVDDYLSTLTRKVGVR